MERGLNDAGYDCSGLIVASMCDVMGISTSEWPVNLRHSLQLEPYVEERTAEPGDILLFYNDKPSRIHLGIFVADKCVVHASGVSEKVEQGTVTGVVSAIKTLSALALREKAQATIQAGAYGDVR
jgi:cell wall-associated NlpC family hydrolase